MLIPDLSVIECNCDENASAIDKYECQWCDLSLEYGCECWHDPVAGKIPIYCHGCETLIEVEAEDLIDEFDEYHGFQDENDNAEPPEEIEGVHYKLVTRCRHYDHPIEFPGGVKVYASSEFEREDDEPGPDFGLYLDGIWKPDGLAYHVSWEDFGLPKRMPIASYAIIDVYNKAKAGLWVEVGCIGGHGRTGTVLACMGVLAGLSPKEAVAYVRKNYCVNAIETSEQEWFVKWFSVFLNGGTIRKPQHWSEDPLAGDSWKFEGKFNADQYDHMDFPNRGPAVDGGTHTYLVKVPIRQHESS